MVWIDDGEGGFIEGLGKIVWISDKVEFMLKII